MSGVVWSVYTVSLWLPLWWCDVTDVYSFLWTNSSAVRLRGLNKQTFTDSVIYRHRQVQVTAFSTVRFHAFDLLLFFLKQWSCDQARVLWLKAGCFSKLNTQILNAAAGHQGSEFLFAVAVHIWLSFYSFFHVQYGSHWIHWLLSLCLSVHLYQNVVLSIQPQLWCKSSGWWFVVPDKPGRFLVRGGSVVSVEVGGSNPALAIVCAQPAPQIPSLDQDKIRYIILVPHQGNVLFMTGQSCTGFWWRLRLFFLHLV